MSQQIWSWWDHEHGSAFYLVAIEAIIGNFIAAATVLSDVIISVLIKCVYEQCQWLMEIEELNLLL